MKSIKLAFLFILFASAILCKNLKKTSQLESVKKPIEKSVDYDSVKSPGDFSNVAPEATQIITPKYANPKLQVIVNVEKFKTPVQKLEFAGNTVVPNHATRVDTAGLFNGENRFTIDTPGLNNKMMLIQTTKNMKMNTVHPVMVDLAHDQANVVEMPNKYKDAKGLYGIN